MANDALDPGPDGTYPYWPRNPDGSPDMERMAGLRREARAGLIDVTPRFGPEHPQAGQPIVPPTIPPGGGGS